jgi:hypothetical protein
MCYFSLRCEPRLMLRIIQRIGKHCSCHRQGECVVVALFFLEAPSLIPQSRSCTLNSSCGNRKTRMYELYILYCTTCKRLIGRHGFKSSLGSNCDQMLTGTYIENTVQTFTVGSFAVRICFFFFCLSERRNLFFAINELRVYVRMSRLSYRRVLCLCLSCHYRSLRFDSFQCPIVTSTILLATRNSGVQK